VSSESYVIIDNNALDDFSVLVHAEGQ